MGLGKSIDKLDDYYDRLAQKKVGKITPDHVDKVLAKLRAKEVKLLIEIDGAAKVAKKERLTGKLAVVREQIQRGEWLHAQITENNETA
ncbi:hypothetical protein SAMN05444000_1278 [Shimia gijangensis]|uniref:Uncharacterized protein n=1 Tax=Shimia gijangensis TaxID=1470563 RepID=A0A1M6RZ48_9RHOB|nr:hypothetical protein [Shimia gijangensis]SHK37731.1 hypothetical protein SAMN05444000_1278 [Shimia gijangensis]